MDSELIQLKGVTKRFRRNIVLDNANLTIPESKITGIIGASGEGKSTILKLLIGFYKPTKGEVLYSKRSVYIDLKNMKKIFGFSTEDGSFYERLTVKENLYHFGRLYKMKNSEIKKRAEELMAFVNLTKARKTRAMNLSVGMKKRLDLACAIMHKPEVLLLDEPTADLDPLLRKQILSLIKDIKKTGTTVILTTQLLEEMDEICDNVAILFDKKIIEQGDPQSIRNKYNSPSLNIVFNKIFTRPRSDSKDYIKPKSEESSKTENKDKDSKDSSKDISASKSESKDSKDSSKKDDEDGMSSILK